MSTTQAQQPDKNLLITQKQAQLVLNYVVTRPYQEVHGLAQILINLPLAPEVVANTTVTDTQANG